MSSILKALRKLQEEKRQGGHSAADISADQGMTAKRSGPLLTLLTGMVLGALMVGVFLLWQPGTPVSTQGELSEIKSGGNSARSDWAPSSEPTKPLENLSESNRGVRQNDHNMPVVQQTGKAIVLEPVPVVVLPPETVATGVKQSPGTSLPAKAAKPSSKAEEPPLAGVKRRTPPSSRSANGAAPAAVNSVAPSRLPDGVTLRVSEIYYQDDGASMAVVNDLPVMIGSQVDAAVIKDIRPDRVLVTIAGQVYTVALSRQ